SRVGECRLYCCWSVFSFFFFQAEDGIRDWSVTGVQTCALPICVRVVGGNGGLDNPCTANAQTAVATDNANTGRRNRSIGSIGARSEERRVGEEGREGGGAGDRSRKRRGRAREEERVAHCRAGEV